MNAAATVRRLIDMGSFLGIDTSNYTTSAAIFDTDTGEMIEKRKLLVVKSGEKGLQQSNAVFQHVKNLPELLSELFKDRKVHVSAVGASVRPRDINGSYMPCFKVGEGTARAIASSLQVPFAEFSHQAGHIASALFSIHRMDLLKGPLIAFHVSGGTTEAVLCSPDGSYRFQTEIISQSLDLKAGQLIDRVGVTLGLSFPAGPALELLAAESAVQADHFHIRPVLKGYDCCLSGVENQCAQMLQKGDKPSIIAQFCLQSVSSVIEGMTKTVRDRFPDLPLLYSGGVMSNFMIREVILKKYQSNIFFANPGYSSDNATGIAALTGYKAENI